MKTIIFDLDGVLIDSMWVWMRLTYDYLTDLGYNPNKDIADELNEMSLDQSPIYLKNKFNMQESPKEISRGIYLTLEKYYKEDIELKNYAREILEYLDKKGYILAIATATDYRLAKIILEKFKIQKYFLFVKTEDQFKKNDLRFYKSLVKDIKTAPEQIYFIDDSLYVLKTAKKAGFKTIGVRDDSNKSERNLIIKNTDYYIENLWELKKLL